MFSVPLLACSLRQELCVTNAMEPQRPYLAALCSLAGRGGRVWVGSDKILKEGGMAARVSWTVSSFSLEVLVVTYTQRVCTHTHSHTLFPSLAFCVRVWVCMCVCTRAHTCVHRCEHRLLSSSSIVNTLHWATLFLTSHQGYHNSIPNWSPRLTP